MAIHELFPRTNRRDQVWHKATYALVHIYTLICYLQQNIDLRLKGKKHELAQIMYEENEGYSRDYQWGNTYLGV